MAAVTCSTISRRKLGPAGIFDEELVHPPRTRKARRVTHSLPLSTYTALGGLRQDPGRAAESLAEARTCGNGSRDARVLLSTYDLRGCVEPPPPDVTDNRVLAIRGQGRRVPVGRRRWHPDIAPAVLGRR
jgi:uncharacterized protein with GYD domain